MERLVVTCPPTAAPVRIGAHRCAAGGAQVATVAEDGKYGVTITGRARAGVVGKTLTAANLLLFAVGRERRLRDAATDRARDQHGRLLDQRPVTTGLRVLSCNAPIAAHSPEGRDPVSAQ